MCGRAVLANPGAIREWFDVGPLPDMPARFNIAPSQLIAVIREPRRLELLRWGIPRNQRPPQINTRVESIAQTASRQRRCLVVVDGFYEWKKDGTTSQPANSFMARSSRRERASTGRLMNRWRGIG
jgi:putative SOS response-associated peptidase YedK